MKPIYSAAVIRTDRQNGSRVYLVKVPCTSEKAAIKYAEILEKWWANNNTTSIVTKDYPVNLDCCKKLEKFPF